MASPTVIDAAWTFDDQNTAQNGRYVMGALFQNAAASTAANSAWRDGVIPGVYSTALSSYMSLRVSENSPTGSSVLVQPGHAVVTRTGQGLYVCPNSTARVVALDAADATNPRIDRIVLQVLDQPLGDSVTQVQIRAVTGTPAGSPVAPATPTGAISLALVAVAAAPTGNTIVNANITDTRRGAGVAGAVRPMLSGDLAADAAQEGDVRDVGGLLERYSASLARWLPIAISNGPLGYVDSAVYSTNGGDFTNNTENIGRSFTFTAKANRRYRVVWRTPIVFFTGSDVTWRHRWATGGSITTSSTLIFSEGETPAIVNNGFYKDFVISFTGPATAGSVTVGFTWQTVASSHTIVAGSATNQASVLVEDIGGV